MASILPGYAYDIFVSYRQRDNKRDQWVTKFVDFLRAELEATIKGSISIYFDENPHDGLHDLHIVEATLKKKLRAVVFLPIISQTYCDSTSFAWNNEFIPFLEMANQNKQGMYITLSNGNITSRVLPVQIHDLDAQDEALLESKLDSPLRAIDFVYRAAGVNRPLTENDDKVREQGQVLFSDQVNKVANALKDIFSVVNHQLADPVSKSTNTESAINTGNQTSNQPQNLVSMDDSLLIKLNEIINKNLDNEQFSVEELASEMAMSRSHLHRKLQKLTGRSISQYVRRIRLNQAYQFLQAEVGTVSEIAYKVGFASNTYFIKCFSDEFGFSPGELRKQKVAAAQPKIDTSIIELAKPKAVFSSSPLEALHPAASESMVVEIFKTVAEFKPSLQKFLIVNEEEDELIDPRLLAYQLIKAYPWPIGIELRRLFSVSLRKAETARRDQLNKAIIRCLKLITYIYTCDLINQVNKGNFKFSKKEAKTINSCLLEINPDNIKVLLETLAEAVDERKLNLFVEEVDNAFDEAFFREINDWVADYNKGQTNLEVTEQCEGLEQVLVFLLQKFAFLAKYRLVNMGSIEVRKRKFKTAAFEHKLHILSSVDADFNLRKEILNEYADSHTVLLMKSIKKPGEFLNLSPLLVDTHSAQSASANHQSLKRDVFLFNGIKHNSPEYYGSETNVKETLEYLDYHEDLVAEYSEMLKLINGNE